MNYHCFLLLQVFENPYFSTLPRFVSPAGSLALSRLFLFSSAGTRSAPHSHALFAASGARAAADIIAIFFTPPPPSLKITNHRASITLHHSQSSLDNSLLFTHFPQRETVDIQRFHAFVSGSFPQFSHIFHTQRQPPG